MGHMRDIADDSEVTCQEIVNKSREIVATALEQAADNIRSGFVEAAGKLIDDVVTTFDLRNGVDCDHVVGYSYDLVAMDSVFLRRSSKDDWVDTRFAFCPICGEKVNDVCDI